MDVKAHVYKHVYEYVNVTGHVSVYVYMYVYVWVNLNVHVHVHWHVHIHVRYRYMNMWRNREITRSIAAPALGELKLQGINGNNIGAIFSGFGARTLACLEGLGGHRPFLPGHDDIYVIGGCSNVGGPVGPV